MRTLRVCTLAVALGWSAGPAHAAEIVRDVVYGHKDGMALVYDVFKPVEPNGAGLLFMMSGGWFSRWSPPEERLEWFARVVERGFTVFAVYHGSAPRYKVPDAVDDVRRAVRHVRAHAGDHGVDPERLGAWGGSAGGHLALMLGTTSDDGEDGTEDPVLRESNRVQAVVAYYPPVDLRKMVGPSEQFPALEFDPELAPRVSPVLHVSKDDPPTLLVHGDADRLVPVDNSHRIHGALEEAGVPCELLVIEGAGHGFRNPEHGGQAGRAMLTWFERHLAAE